EHAMHAHALVVGLEEVRTRREGDAGMLEALEQSREDAAQQRHVRHQEVGGGEWLLGIACALLGLSQNSRRRALRSPLGDALTTAARRSPWHPWCGGQFHNIHGMR